MTSYYYHSLVASVCSFLLKFNWHLPWQIALEVKLITHKDIANTLLGRAVKEDVLK